MEPPVGSRLRLGMSEHLSKMPVPALIALVLLAAITVGLLLPGPSHSKPEPRSSLQTLSIHAS
jgi:hypothetical protein